MLTSSQMRPQSTRPAAVAGSWYPASPARLEREVDDYLARADRDLAGEVVALIAPHAGLRYSGPVAAFSYRLVADRTFDVVVLVGPSHFVGFEGVALPEADRFDFPLGPVSIADRETEAILGASPLVRRQAAAHAREHSLEMQLPFVGRVLRDVPIVPLLMGHQTRETVEELGRALAQSLAGRRVLLVASTDLSHYFDARTAASLDREVIELVERFDPEGLLAALEDNPQHACGGGPTVSVMLAAQALGARDAAVLRYADSGDVSGDKSAVVGYLAAAFGTFSKSVERRTKNEERR
jgi:AmmeMemoRadiSam system protein B